MDDTQRIVKCGNLSLHTPGGFFKKRWHSKYLVLYDGSKSGVKRLELFDSEIKFKKQNPAKIIPLVDCVRVVTCQRNKTTYTFEVRTSDQFYLLAAQSFQDMSDWVNCLRLVAFGQSSSSSAQANSSSPPNKNQSASSNFNLNTSSQTGLDNRQAPKTRPTSSGRGSAAVDVLLESAKKRPQQQQEAAMSRTADYVRSLDQPTANKSSSSLSPGSVVASAIGGGGKSPQQVNATAKETSGYFQTSTKLTTASQAAAAAASALAKTRQRQPSLLGSCKPQPPMDSPFIHQAAAAAATTGGPIQQAALIAAGQLDTMTPTVRGQLISSGSLASVATSASVVALSSPPTPAAPPTAADSNLKSAPISLQFQQKHQQAKQQLVIQATLDEEEENMLYCSIEDNPSEHNYRVKVIETELSLRCQLKCYQLTAPTTVCQQYEQLGQLLGKTSAGKTTTTVGSEQQQQLPVTFYQLIIGPQELTLLNDYAAARQQQHQATGQQQQGLWSWPYQCIRRYGFDKDNCFMFEAGRKCSSGPGQFIVQTPKAYQIYQDVVKFVNELRSLSSSSVLDTTTTTTTTAEMATATPDETSKQQQNSSVASVTQIPVSWTPSVPASTASIGISSDPAVNRQQFFDTLRQLDASASAACGAKSVSPPAISRQQQQLPLPPTKQQQHQQQQQQSRQPSSQLVKSHQAKSQPDLAATTTTATLNSEQLAATNFSSTSHKIHASISSSHLNLQQQGGQKAVAPIFVTPTSRVSPPPQAPSQQQILASQTTENNHNSGAKVLQQPPLPSVPASTNTTSSGKKCSSIAASDETDESGYDQGEDSVDSSSTIVNTRQQQKLPSTNSAANGSSRKWPPPASDSSMSSASSTSSGAGSPGHSVGRRSAGSVLANSNPPNLPKAQGHASKRTPLPTVVAAAATGNASAKSRLFGSTGNVLQSALQQSDNNKLTATSGGTGGNTSGLRSILAASQAGDFEANLIRDVYSEISKLHAKFAVTSGSAEDSMSNSSGSNEGFGSNSDNCSSGSGGLMTEQDVVGAGDSPHREPMYTNCRFEKHQQQQRAGNRGAKNCEHNDNSPRRLRRDPFLDLERDEQDYEDEEDDLELELAEGRRNHLSNLGINNNKNKCSQQPTARHSNSSRAIQQQQSQSHNYLEPRQFVHSMTMDPHDNSYTSRASAGYDNGYLSCLQQPQSRCGSGLYPSILNPIPECGELERPPQQRPSSRIGGQNANPTAKPKPATPTSNDVARQTNFMLSNNNSGGGGKQQTGTGGLHNRRIVSSESESRLPNNQLQGNMLKSKFPTNHYVINDVQYAKISRSIRSKYEACL